MKTGLSTAERLRLLLILKAELVMRCVSLPGELWVVTWDFQFLGFWDYTGNTPRRFPLGRLQNMHNLVVSSLKLVQQSQGCFMPMGNL